jgi:hypothetical protein
MVVAASGFFFILFNFINKHRVVVVFVIINVWEI